MTNQDTHSFLFAAPITRRRLSLFFNIWFNEEIIIVDALRRESSPPRGLSLIEMERWDYDRRRWKILVSFVLFRLETRQEYKNNKRRSRRSRRRRWKFIFISFYHLSLRSHSLIQSVNIHTFNLRATLARATTRTRKEKKIGAESTEGNGRKWNILFVALGLFY